MRYFIAYVLANRIPVEEIQDPRGEAWQVMFVDGGKADFDSAVNEGRLHRINGVIAQHEKTHTVWFPQAELRDMAFIARHLEVVIDCADTAVQSYMEANN